MLSHSFRVYLFIYVFCKDYKTARYDDFTPPIFIHVKDFWGVMGDLIVILWGSVSASFCLSINLPLKLISLPLPSL